MSAARPAASPVRRPINAAAAPAPASRAPGRAAFFSVQPDKGEEELKLNLSDLPPAEQSLDVDGFKPSLLSRLLDLLSPVHKR